MSSMTMCSLPKVDKGDWVFEVRAQILTHQGDSDVAIMRAYEAARAAFLSQESENRAQEAAQIKCSHVPRIPRVSCQRQDMLIEGSGG